MKLALLALLINKNYLNIANNWNIWVTSAVFYNNFFQCRKTTHNNALCLGSKLPPSSGETTKLKTLSTNNVTHAST